MASGLAVVKAVISGDTLVLMGNSSNNGPPPELSITLASLQAPRLARTSEQTDEAFAYASREYLRQLCIGKQVRFKVEYRVASINRDFGSVYLNGENLCILVAKEGWAKVKTLDQSRDGCSPDLDDMLQAEQFAFSEKKGMYSDDTKNASLNVEWNGASGEELLGQYKGQQIPAIIEMVRDGASMRVILLTNMQIVNFALSGVQCPRMNPPASAVVEETPQGPQPFATEGKLYTEVRLLHRRLNVKLEGVDKFGNLFGSVVHPSGNNISIELLKAGLAKISDWSISFTSPGVRSDMRNAEKNAKLNKLRLWTNYVAPVLSTDKDLHGIIVEIVSGDCVVISMKDNKEQRVYLSSIRAPRLGNAKRNEKNTPYAIESKEFLRNKCIGKQVVVEIEYEKNNPNLSSGNSENTMVFGSVLVEGSKNSKGKKSSDNNDAGDNRINIGETLLLEGLAEVVFHKQDEEKSNYYDALVAAEAQAKSSKKGMFSNKPSPEPRVTDLCFDSNKAKQYLPFLTREKTQRAIIEQVYAGNRFKLYIPKENCMVNFILGGIKCPNPQRFGPASASGPSKVTKEAELFGEEAKRFARKHVNQRNVFVEIEDMDRVGNAFGPIYIGSKDSKNNFGCHLLSNGYARIDEFSVERTSTSQELMKAEEVAKQGRKNIWKNVIPNAGNEPAVKKNVTKRENDEILQCVKVSEIVCSTHFYIQNLTDRVCSTVENLMKEFTTQHGVDGKAFEFRKGTVCAALFQDDSGLVWNRAKIESIQGNSIHVRFIDYGNGATVPATRLRPLDPQLSAFPPQAKECVLGFLKPMPPLVDYGSDAAHIFNDLAWGHTLVARVHGHDAYNRVIVSLFYNNKNISEQLLEAGIARVDRKAARYCETFQKNVVDGLIKSQELAKKRRLCLWQYGDIESDDEEASGRY